MPDIAEAALTALQFSSIVWTELLTPDSNRFIGDNDSAFGEKILDISEAQAETMVNPNGIADDFRRETMTVVARPTVLHGPVFQFLPKLTMPSQYSRKVRPDGMMTNHPRAAVRWNDICYHRLRRGRPDNVGPISCVRCAVRYRFCKRCSRLMATSSVSMTACSWSPLPTACNTFCKITIPTT